jgi:hypothetical protein
VACRIPVRRVAVYAASNDIRRLAAPLVEKDERTVKQSNSANRHDSLAIESAFVKTGCSGVAGHGTANRPHQTGEGPANVVD